MISRIKKIIEYTALSDRAFALKCGMNQPTLFNQLKGLRSISLDTILAIGRTFPEISRDWLLYGEGDMLKANNKDINTERMLKLLDTITTLQATINAQSDTINVLTERIKQLEN